LYIFICANAVPNISGINSWLSSLYTDIHSGGARSNNTELPLKHK
jgi:hypothetical protein